MRRVNETCGNTNLDNAFKAYQRLINSGATYIGVLLFKNDKTNTTTAYFVGSNYGEAVKWNCNAVNRSEDAFLRDVKNAYKSKALACVPGLSDEEVRHFIETFAKKMSTRHISSDYIFGNPYFVDEDSSSLADYECDDSYRLYSGIYFQNGVLSQENFERIERFLERSLPTISGSQIDSNFYTSCAEHYRHVLEEEIEMAREKTPMIKKPVYVSEPYSRRVRISNNYGPINIYNNN